MQSNPQEQRPDSTSATPEIKGKWLTPGVWSIGLASFLADVGHEVFLITEKWLIPKLSEFACFVFRLEEHRQENGLTDERKAISLG